MVKRVSATQEMKAMFFVMMVAFSGCALGNGSDARGLAGPTRSFGRQRSMVRCGDVGGG